MANEDELHTLGRFNARYDRAAAMTAVTTIVASIVMRVYVIRADEELASSVRVQSDAITDLIVPTEGFEDFLPLILSQPFPTADLGVPVKYYRP